MPSMFVGGDWVLEDLLAPKKSASAFRPLTRQPNSQVRAVDEFFLEGAAWSGPFVCSSTPEHGLNVGIFCRRFW